MAMRVGRFASGSGAMADGSGGGSIPVLVAGSVAGSVATARAAVLSVMFLFWRRRQALVGPAPLPDLGSVLALGTSVGPGLGALVLHQLADVAGPRRQSGDSGDGGRHDVGAV